MTDTVRVLIKVLRLFGVLARLTPNTVRFRLALLMALVNSFDAPGMLRKD